MREEEEEEDEGDLITTQPYTLPNTPNSARTDQHSSGRLTNNVCLIKYVSAAKSAEKF